MISRVDVALGSNVGDRAAWLAIARAALSLLPRTRLLAVSSVEETAPLGGVAQGPYLNQMVALGTSLAPLALLDELQRIESRLGRVRRRQWGARTIDLDIVRAEGAAIATPRLTLPHPGIAARGFWRRELDELDRIVERAG